MSTQFVTLDSAQYVNFAGPAGAPRPQPSTDNRQLGDSEFFNGKSIAELAREQRVGPVRDIRDFAGVIPDDEDVDEMLAEIYRLREP